MKKAKESSKTTATISENVKGKKKTRSENTVANEARMDKGGPHAYRNQTHSQSS